MPPASSANRSQTATPINERSRRNPLIRWMPWIIAAAVLASVIYIGIHYSEGREFADILQRARPFWLLIATLLQIATYFAQGEVFRVGPRAQGFSLSRWWLFQVSFAKLFLDQALPSGGVTSAAFVDTAMEENGVSREASVSAAMIEWVTYYTGYVVALAAALAFTRIFGSRAVFIIALSLLFLAFSVAATTAILMLSGRRGLSQRKFFRVPVLRGIVSFLEGADPAIVRSPRILAEATFWQVVIFVLDALTIWVLIRSVGASAALMPVYVSFIVSSLFRTMGIVPGGIGTYEAASVFTLRMIGLNFAVALSATLLFRGLSFWLPMLPGLWLSRRVTKKHGEAITEESRRAA